MVTLFGTPFLHLTREQWEHVQRHATKLIVELKDNTYVERLQALDLPSLLYRRTRGDIIFLYRMIHNDAHLSFPILLSLEVIITSFTNPMLDVNQELVSFQLDQLIFNNLPEQVVNANTVCSFRYLFC